MQEDLKKWARAQVEEQMRYMTREMDKEEQDWCEARYAYKKIFGAGFPSFLPIGSLEKETALMWRYIEKGKPYVSNLPKGTVV